MWRDKTSVHTCFHLLPQRYIFVLFSFFYMWALSIVKNSIHIAMPSIITYHKTQMIDDQNMCSTEEKFVYRNVTHAVKRSLFGKVLEPDVWNDRIPILQVTFFYIGYILTHVPAGIIADRFGGKFLLLIGLFSASIINIITPLSIYLGPDVFFLIQFMNGVLTGPIFPALTAVYARWIPPIERGRVATILFAGNILGAVFNRSAGIAMIRHWGWPTIFYATAWLGMLADLMLFIWIYSLPDEDPFITDHEKVFLASSIEGSTPPKDLQPIPWSKILTSVPVLAIMVCHFGHKWGRYIMDHEARVYMLKLVKRPPAMTGILGAHPYFLKALVAITAGFVGDQLIKMKTASYASVRKFFMAFASFGPAVSYLLVSYQGCHKIRSHLFYSLGIIVIGFYDAVFMPSLVDLSPNYAGTLMGLINGVAQLVAIISPRLTNVITTNNSLHEWRFVFWIAFILVCFSATFFLNFSEHSVQKWNNPVPEPVSSDISVFSN